MPVFFAQALEGEAPRFHCVHHSVAILGDDILLRLSEIPVDGYKPRSPDHKLETFAIDFLSLIDLKGLSKFVRQH